MAYWTHSMENKVISLTTKQKRWFMLTRRMDGQMVGNWLHIRQVPFQTSVRVKANGGKVWHYCSTAICLYLACGAILIKAYKWHVLLLITWSVKNPDNTWTGCERRAEVVFDLQNFNVTSIKSDEMSRFYAVFNVVMNMQYESWFDVMRPQFEKQPEAREMSTTDPQ